MNSISSKVLALMLGILFQPRQGINVMNIIGLLFMLLLNMTFQNAGSVIDVSHSIYKNMMNHSL